MGHFLIFFIPIALLRASDLLCTYFITPDLTWELNPLMRWLGWKGTITLNVVACVGAALERGWFWLAVVILSVLAIAWNVRILLHRIG